MIGILFLYIVFGILALGAIAASMLLFRGQE